MEVSNDVELKQFLVRKYGPAKADALMLKYLDVTHREKLEELREAVERRKYFLNCLKHFAEDGKIAVIESGRDCDGVQYDGKVHTIRATVADYNRLADGIAEWADGPFRLELASPSLAATVKYTSRDLVMEAFEDGHQHVIYAQPLGSF